MNQMKVAVTSKSFSKSSDLRSALIKEFPLSYFNDQELNFQSQDELVEFLGEADCAIVGLEKVNENLLAQLPRLKVISKYGVGTDNIDFDAIKKFQIRWGYSPGTNKTGVAELALQMMLVLIRKSFSNNLKMRDKKWSVDKGLNLSGKKVGILGLGHVGKELVKLLRPFECQVSCCDLSPDLEFIKQHNINLVDARSLFLDNLIVSIHIPYSASNHLFVGEELLGLISESGVLINTARGGLVDEFFLKEKILKHPNFFYGSDVFMNEPHPDWDLVTHPQVFSTSHIGGSSLESIWAMGMSAIQNIHNARHIAE